MSKVYVVQNQHRYDEASNTLVPRFDLSSAEQYGQLCYLLSPSAAPWHPESVMAELVNKLNDFAKEDYLLLIGNPVLIGMASAVAADVAGTVTFLQWNGRTGSYLPVTVKIFEEEEKDA